MEFPYPIFTPNRIANGTMFTVEALNNVSIFAISTYTSRIENGTIQVYTRQGPYSNHTANDEGWTLIFDQLVHQQGIDKLTRLVFSDDQSLNVTAGDSVSFYVYTPKKLTYQFSNAWEEGSAVTDDGSLRLFAGAALAYGKWEEGCGGASPQQGGQCIFRPRVFSGVLEYAVHLPPGSAHDAAPRPAPPLPTWRGKKAKQQKRRRE